MDWLATIVNGLLLGGLYGMFGLGLALVFGVMRVVNLAHGEFIVIGALVGYFLFGTLPQVPPLLLLLPIALIGYATGWALQAGVVNRSLRSGFPLTPMMLTFGLSVVLRNGMIEIFGANSRAVDGGAWTRTGIALGPVQVGLYPLALLAGAILLFVGLQLLLRHTAFGRTVRATADAPDIVRLMGVTPERVFAQVMGLSIAFAMVAGYLLALRSSFTPFSGVERMLLAFEVVILGGMGSLWGALLGGMALGVAQLVGQKIDSNAGPLYAHLAFVLVLLFMPKGLAGARR